MADFYLKRNMAQYRCETREFLSESDRKMWKGLWEASEGRHFFNSPTFFEAALKTYSFKKYLIIFGYEGEALVAVLPLVYDRVFGIRALAGPGRRYNHLDASVLLLGKRDVYLVEMLIAKALEYAPLYLAEVTEEVMFLLSSTKHPHIEESSARCLWLDVREEKNILGQMSSRERRKLLSRIRKCGRDLEFVFSVDDVARSLEMVVSIERVSHKPGKGMALFRHREARDLFDRVITLGEPCLGIGILFFQKEPVAHFLGFVSGKTFAMYHTAYADRLASLGIGKMATYFLLKHLHEAGFEKADFMRGDTEAKRQFARNAVDQYTLYFARRGYIRVWWRVMIVAKQMAKRMKGFVWKWLF